MQKNNTVIKENKPMPKWLIYSLFILKFVLGLGLIYWTIYMTLQSDVGEDDDNAFLSSYHQVDDSFNKIVADNKIFETVYNIKFDLNDETIIGLSYDDIFLSQRAIQNRKTRKNILKVGDNNFNINVQDKNGNEIKDVKIDILVTKSTNHKEDIKLFFNNENTKNFKINSIGYWNITGTIEVDKYKGTFYIKTNAKNFMQ
ncbi:MAG: hypothetical protein U9R39_09810 [Campylobacterota bacterium]|nr:hypothetical protein [Campylobacterota bacterium]